MIFCNVIMECYTLGIFRAGLDGGGRMTLVETDLLWPNGMTIGKFNSYCVFIIVYIHLGQVCESTLLGHGYGHTVVNADISRRTPSVIKVKVIS